MIEIPIWLLVLLAVLASWSLLERIFLPSVRWYLRRRVNAVIDQVNRRLDVSIRPFQLTKRRVLLQRLVYDPKVMAAQEQLAQEQGVPRDVVQERVRRYANEIIPAFNAYLYYRFGYWLAKRVVRFLYDVRVGFRDAPALDQVDTQSTIVFVMNHRSNMDYVLVSFLASQRTTLSYAVGEWARIWPLQSLIKSMGAYFVRRNSGNALYRKVLERYIAMATEEGVCQAMFPEGGLTRDGRLRPPKLGVLDYMLRNYDHQTNRDVVFIPVGINYERTLEDRTLLRSLDPTATKRSSWFATRTTLSFIARNLRLMWAHRWKNFGNAGVVFGRPVSARAFCQERGIEFARLDRATRFVEIEELATRIMAEVGSAVPVVPVALVCDVVLQREGSVDRMHLKALCVTRMDALLERGAVPVIPAHELDDSLDSAIAMLLQRKLLTESNGAVQANSEESTILLYYANSLRHYDEVVGAGIGTSP